MASIYDVEPNKLIMEVAKELEKMPEMAPPDWAIAAKTGVSKERPPVQDNWWYIRAAAVLRKIEIHQPIGVSKLRVQFSDRKNRGYAPDKTYKAGGNIIRKILQKLELVGFVKQGQVGLHKGRVLTPKGKSFLDKISLKLKPKYENIKKEKSEDLPVKEKKPRKRKGDSNEQIQAASKEE